jgi:hypothetical protein
MNRKPDAQDEKQQRGGGDRAQHNEQQQGGREQYKPGERNRQSDQGGDKK